MDGAVSTRFWTHLHDGRLRCDVCPRGCKLRRGQRGLCFVRARPDEAEAWPRDEVVLTTYGRSSGFCVDPIEKKPLNHFLPGSPVLSFGTAGCNLACDFCQNWDISKSREMDTLAARATPEAIAEAAVDAGCKSVAFTYNDPVIFLEYAVDVADACHAHDLKTVAVTAGYVNPRAREAFFASIDAANVDLKAFDDDFYRKVTKGRLAPVLETLRYLVHETDVWVELTTLLIPGLNDGDEELEAMTGWVVEALGPDVPMHFTAFHPDYRMRDRPRTSLSTVLRARDIARRAGLRFVYTGNVGHGASGSTYCAGCARCVIERVGYVLGTYDLDPHGACKHCGTVMPGVFDGPAGRWGARRLPIVMGL